MSPDEPDEVLERYRQLNDRFYASEPAEFLRTRLVILFAFAGKTDEIVDLLRGGVEHLGIAVRLIGNDRNDDADTSKYVLIESQVLLHHAAEAVLRLFIAHRDRSPCPWLEVAAAKNFAAFKDDVRSTVLSPRRRGALTREVAWVFLGHEDAPKEDAAEWESAAENLVKFMRVFAERWLDESHIYNALKHGLAAVPGEAVFQVIDDESNRPVRLGEGASVEILQATPWNDDHRTWQLTTRWIDVKESLGLVDIACRMIESMWTIARHRYVNGEPSGELFFPVELTPNALRGERGSMRTFSMNLLEEQRTR